MAVLCNGTGLRAFLHNRSAAYVYVQPLLPSSSQINIVKIVNAYSVYLPVPVTGR